MPDIEQNDETRVAVVHGDLLNLNNYAMLLTLNRIHRIVLEDEITADSLYDMNQYPENVALISILHFGKQLPSIVHLLIEKSKRTPFVVWLFVMLQRTNKHSCNWEEITDNLRRTSDSRMCIDFSDSNSPRTSTENGNSSRNSVGHFSVDHLRELDEDMSSELSDDEVKERTVSATLSPDNDHSEQSEESEKVCSRQQTTRVSDGIEEVSRVRSKSARFNDRNESDSKRQQSARMNDHNEEVQRIHLHITREIDAFEAVTRSNQQSVRIDNEREEVRRILPQIDRINDENEIGWDHRQSTRVQNKSEEVKMLPPQIDQVREENEVSLRRQQSTRITNGNEEIVRVRPQIARTNDTKQVSLKHQQSARIEKCDETDDSEDIEKGFTFPDEENEEVARARSHIDRVNEKNESVTWNREQSVRIDDEHEEVGRIRPQIDRINDREMRPKSVQLQRDRSPPDFGQILDEINESVTRLRHDVSRDNHRQEAVTKTDREIGRLSDGIEENMTIRAQVGRANNKEEAVLRNQPTVSRFNDENETFTLHREQSTRIESEMEEFAGNDPQSDRVKHEHEVVKRSLKQNTRVRDEIEESDVHVAETEQFQKLILKQKHETKTSNVRIDAQNKEIGKLQNDKKRLMAQVESLQCNVKRFGSIKEELRKLMMKSEQVIHTKDGEIKKLNGKLCQIQAEHRALLNGKEREWARMECQYRKSHQEITEHCQEMEKIVGGARLENENLNAEIDGFQKAMKLKDQDIERLKAKLQQNEKINGSLQCQRKQNEDLLRVIEDKDIKIELLREKDDENDLGRDHQQSTRVQNESEEVKMLRPQIDQVREENEVSLRRQQSTRTANGNEEIVRIRPQIVRINDTNNITLKRRQSARMEKCDETDDSEDIEKGFTFPDEENEEGTRVRSHIDRVNEKNETITWNREQSVLIEYEHEEVGRILRQEDGNPVENDSNPVINRCHTNLSKEPKQRSNWTETIHQIDDKPENMVSQRICTCLVEKLDVLHQGMEQPLDEIIKQNKILRRVYKQRFCCNFKHLNALRCKKCRDNITDKG